MLSRVADSVYWLGRYLERAENYARFLDVNFNLSLDLPPDLIEQWQPLVSVTGDTDRYKEFHKKYSQEKVIHFMAFEKQNPNSIISSIRYARENARIVRESISKEIWGALNDLYHYMNNAYKRKMWEKDNPQDFFTQVKQRVELVYGINFSTTTREEGWYFFQLGQYLERADKTSRILDVKYHTLLPAVEEVGSPLDYIHWAALLKSVSGFNAYRRYYGKTSPQSVVDFLILNQYFPRSVYFCLTQAMIALEEISGNKRGSYSAAEKSLGNLRSDLEYADVREIIEFGLHEYIDNLQVKVNEISDHIYDQYFKIRTNFAQQNQDQ